MGLVRLAMGKKIDLNLLHFAMYGSVEGRILTISDIVSFAAPPECRLIDAENVGGLLKRLC